MKVKRNTNIVVFSNTRIALQWSLILAAGLCLTACKHNVKVANGGDAPAIYTLSTVNGSTIPARVSHDGTPLEIRSGVFTINADGTCASKMVFVPPSGAESTRDVSASYKREGSRLTMRWKGAGQTTGDLDGDTFTMNNEGMVFIYKK
jgi:hypothetical protein